MELGQQGAVCICITALQGGVSLQDEATVPSSARYQIPSNILNVMERPSFLLPHKISILVQNQHR